MPATPRRAAAAASLVYSMLPKLPFYLFYLVFSGRGEEERERVREVCRAEERVVGEEETEHGDGEAKASPPLP